MTDEPGEREPGPGPLVRLAGAGAVAGAILWPVTLSGMATSLVAEAAGSGPAVRLNPILPLAFALLLFAAAVAALEYRAATDIGFVDLVGDLSIGMAAAVITVAAAFGTYELLGPGFAVLFAGSVVFGAAGLDGARRPRWGSALVAIGAGGLMACFVVVAALGGSRLAELAQTAMLSLLLYASGWAWLGLHLALGRRLGSTTAGRSRAGGTFGRD